MAFSDVMNALARREPLVIEDFGNPPFTAAGITALNNTIIMFSTVLGCDQLHQIRGFPTIVLHLDNIIESPAFTHAEISSASYFARCPRG